MRGPAILLILLTTLSTLALPALGVSNLGPFFDWRLFDHVNRGDFYDLRVEDQGVPKMATEGSPKYFKQGFGIKIWYLTQAAGRGPNREMALAQIADNLALAQMRPERLCRLKIDLAQYVLLSNEEKSRTCEDLPAAP